MDFEWWEIWQEYTWDGKPLFSTIQQLVLFQSGNETKAESRVSKAHTLIT